MLTGIVVADFHHLATFGTLVGLSGHFAPGSIGEKHRTGLRLLKQVFRFLVRIERMATAQALEL
jgi:hypothetical protein